MTKLIFITLILAACGDGGTNVSDGPPAALSIIAGDNQSDTVLATLDTPITVEVLDGADTPISGVIVNFVVPTPDCGAPFAGSASTNDLGRAADLWVLGTKAGPCTMEVRAVTAAGVPQVLGSVEATILPGAVVGITAWQGSAWVGDKIAVSDLAEFKDAHNNTLSNPTVTLVGDVAGIEQVGDSIWSVAEREEIIGFQVGSYTSHLDASIIAWFQDLRLSSWQVAFSCSASTDFTVLGSPPDSIAVVMALDSVNYGVLPGTGMLHGTANATGSLFFSGTQTRVTGPDTIVVPANHDGEFFIQRAGVIEWGTGKGSATSSEGVPSTYTGGDWCVRAVAGWSDWQNSSPVFFSKTP